MINTQPEVCNLCGGKVIYTSNARVYHGREYGSGYCYLCLACGAYVGTHKPHPKEALGLLADENEFRTKALPEGRLTAQKRAGEDVCLSANGCRNNPYSPTMP